MEYTPIPTHALSKSRLAMLQRIHNIAFQQAYNVTSYPPRFFTEEQKRKTKLNRINQRLPNLKGKLNIEQYLRKETPHT